MMVYQIRPMTEENAHKIVRWRYDSPYNYYNPDANRERENISRFLNHHNPYYEVNDENDELIGFCCFGSEGQVPGGCYDHGSLDIGIGMRPNLTGLGKGSDFFTAVLDFAKEMFSPAVFQVTVALFNQRAIRLYQRMGFERKNQFIGKIDGEGFVQMVRTA